MRTVAEFRIPYRQRLDARGDTARALPSTSRLDTNLFCLRPAGALAAAYREARKDAAA